MSSGDLETLLVCGKDCVGCWPVQLSKEEEQQDIKSIEKASEGKWKLSFNSG